MSHSRNSQPTLAARMAQAAQQIVRRTYRTVMAVGLVAAAVATLAAPVAANSGEVNFNRTSTLVRGDIHLTALDVCANKVYAPVKDSEGNLRNIGLSLVGDNLGNLAQNHNQHLGGTIQEVEIAGLRSCNNFVTAVRTNNNTLKLIAWFSGAEGIQRLGDTGNHNMAVTEIDLGSVMVSQAGFPTDGDTGYVIAAVRAATGQFALTSYWVDGGSFQHQDLVMGETATKISLAMLPPLNPFYKAGRAVVAYRTGQGNLRLAVYDVSHAATFALTGDSGNQAGAVQDVAIAAYDTNKVITAVKVNDGTLKLIPWRINDDGTITRLTGVDDPAFNNPTAGAVSEIDVVAYHDSVPGMNHFVVTAVRTAEGNLRLIAWGINGGDIVRLGDSGDQAGSATSIRVGWSNNSQRIVTAMRDGEGKLRVVTWQPY